MAGTAFSPLLSSDWSASPSYLWEVPGKAAIVYVALEVLDRLDREVVESFRSLRARGAEIGGFLLGAVKESSPLEVFIQSYLVVPSEYKRGPLYKLSSWDLERFEAGLKQRVGAALQIVGYFRSHTRKGLSLDTEDVALFNRFFPEQYQVALLAKPFATKPTAGAIFIREGSFLKSDSSYKEFFFRTSTVEPRGVILPPFHGPGSKAANRAVSDIAAGMIAVSAQSAAALTAPPELQPSPDRQTTPQWSTGKTGVALRAVRPICIGAFARLAQAVRAARPICATASAKLATAATAVRPMWVAASARLAEGVKAERAMRIAGGSALAMVVVSGVLLSAGLHGPKRRATTSPRNPSTLTFRVERSAGELLLTWNRDADVIHEATHAVLAIADGDRHQNVDLDQAQLRDGGIVYLPFNSEINFQLTVTGRNASQTQSESVRVLRVSPWATPEPSPASPLKRVIRRTTGAKPVALRSSKASAAQGAELAKAPSKDAPEAGAPAQSSGSSSALNLPDAPVLTSPKAQAALVPNNTAAPAGDH